MINCKQVSQLISKSQDSQLRWLERLEIRFHLIMCKYCKRFSLQVTSIRKALKLMSQTIEENPEIQLPSETKRRIAESIKSETD